MGYLLMHPCHVGLYLEPHHPHSPEFTPWRQLLAQCRNAGHGWGLARVELPARSGSLAPSGETESSAIGRRSRFRDAAHYSEPW